jgi:rhodanese-related sulfurtransferase
MTQSISAKDLKARKQEFVIIDVRESDELAQGTIEGSIHMPLGAVTRNAKKGKLEDLKSKKICTHCSGGYRGNMAAEELNKVGFQAVNLEGGFEAWSKV